MSFPILQREKYAIRLTLKRNMVMSKSIMTKYKSSINFKYILRRQFFRKIINISMICKINRNL